MQFVSYLRGERGGFWFLIGLGYIMTPILKDERDSSLCSHCCKTHWTLREWWRKESKRMGRSKIKEFYLTWYSPHTDEHSATVDIITAIQKIETLAFLHRWERGPCRPTPLPWEAYWQLTVNEERPKSLSLSLRKCCQLKVWGKEDALFFNGVDNELPL